MIREEKAKNNFFEENRPPFVIDGVWRRLFSTKAFTGV
jgi:hypothetical protein